MSKTAIVTGAGSGVGQSVALELAREGWNVGLIGRRVQALQETISMAGDHGSRMLAAPADVADVAQVTGAVSAIAGKFGPAQALVAAAGINIPKRSWPVLTPEDYRKVIDVNLNGAFYTIHAALPAMRTAGGGTIVTIVSDAGMQANAKAGAAYCASKFGLRGLCQSLNLEERGNGIRCTAIFPGDINTPILDKRPVPPPPEARVKMLQAEDITACVMLAINLPDRAIVEEMLVRPR
jgi:NAD(P)-dependent dehydrogenase (short-subunit alcohol dehydrogenase family)